MELNETVSRHCPCYLCWLASGPLTGSNQPPAPTASECNSLGSGKGVAGRRARRAAPPQHGPRKKVGAEAKGEEEEEEEDKILLIRKKKEEGGGGG